ncbi:protein of unknown function DUF181 [Catenulispora acidiphila DSM 44928]|uniref:YcaO domain-containing protein n=1 Tax=Catenulispora acidiphila (strain DSM 44928 / JCM 14897 / NBRC 102108 / NRRL B-24433 / ID139908) TaxID=479433 RepID=C7QI26_CATAD|nr:protein of unknown function DUF181 [Catenulispora acidiphila DSM 44928]
MLPWASACARFEEGLRQRTGLDAVVAPLGVRDELDGPISAPETSSGMDNSSIPLHFTGRHIIAGPLGEQSCARCLARRWQRIRDPLVRDALEIGGPTHAAGMPPQLTDFALDATAALLLHLIDEAPSTGSSTAEPFVYQLDLVEARILRTQVMADPDCPDCRSHASCDNQTGRANQTAWTPIADLPPAPRSKPGSSRVRDADAFDLPADALVNPVCGVLGQVKIEELDLPTTSSVLGVIAERAGGRLYEVFWGGHRDTYRRSLRTGVLEGFERYAGLRPRGQEPPLVAAFDDLTVPALDPRDCGMYAPEFYEQDPETKAFATDRKIPWVRGYSLRDDREILVPLVMSYYHCEPHAERFVQQCSNGCASGGSVAEAVLSGLLELIERDAFLLTWFGRQSLPELDPRTSEHAETRHLVERLAMYGYEARFFDTRLAFPVPVITAVAVRRTPGLGALCFGAGAALDPEEALAAGLAEIATDALHARRRAERDEAELRAMAADFTQVIGLHDHSRLYGLPEMAQYASFLLDAPRAALLPLKQAFGEAPPRTGDLREDLAACVGHVTAAGFDTIVVDQTAPEQRRLGLSTVGVIVPGLVPIDFGWTRQRAPLMPRLHALTGATTPNPAPHPFP